MRNYSAPPILSPSVRAFLTQSCQKIIGIALLVIGMAGMAMVVSHSATDPSLNTASDSQVFRNIFGQLGAHVASFTINSFGWVAGIALMLIPSTWGVRFWRNTWRGSLWLRCLLLLPVLVLLSASVRIFGGDGSMAGAAGEIVYTLISNAPLLTQPLTPSLPITAQHVLIATMLLLAGLGYTYVASIGMGEMRILTAIIRLIQRLIHYAWLACVATLGLGRRLATTAGGSLPSNTTSSTATKLADKQRQRPPPTPRREPIIITGSDDNPAATASRQKSAPHQPSLHLPTPDGYTLPPSQFLAPPQPSNRADATSLDNTSRMLESVLGEFSIGGHIEKARYGPVVTRYELQPAPGTKTQRVIALADDIARSMSALSVRVAVTPGQNTIGIELPNSDREPVLLRHIFDHQQWAATTADLPLALGVDITGVPLVVDLAAMPHLLVAGTTGSGKSVGLNAMILSLLYRHTPDACRLILIDPKMLEFSVYDGIPHLLTPVVTEPAKAIAALKWACREMEARYRLLAETGVRNIDGYNKAVLAARQKGTPLTRRLAQDEAVDNDTDPTTAPLPPYADEELQPMPALVIVIDEVADLMLLAGKEIEALVQRLAQMARAAGIHVIMATQRPSVDVITGTIKANFPTRISFQVTSRVDSRTILGDQGAESLLGGGDMLYMEGGGRIRRVHGPFVSDSEIAQVASFLRDQGAPLYDEAIMAELAAANVTQYNNSTSTNDALAASDTDLYQQALDIIRRHNKVSISFIQRHLRIGYNRAATIIEEMEANGVITPPDHSGRRSINQGSD